MSQASFAKRQREKERREKAEAKAVRRAERKDTSSTDERPPPLPAADEGALLAELAALHARFDEGEMDFEDFAAAKEQITQRLQVG